MAWWDRGPRDEAKPSLRARARSLYESRFKPPEDDPDAKKVRRDKHGNPVLVTARGECIGVRAVDGSLIPAPEPPRDPRSWPEEMWDESDAEWVWIGGRWQKRFR